MGVAARDADAKAASAASSMFRMLVFLIAVPNLMLVSWLGLVCLSSGNLTEGLPFAAMCLMCSDYFVRGAAETIEYVRGRIK